MEHTFLELLLVATLIMILKDHEQDIITLPVDTNFLVLKKIFSAFKSCLYDFLHR